ncbi:hypothetical protein HK101_005640, partial [Irineochytrium annulatum]
MSPLPLLAGAAFAALLLSAPAPTVADYTNLGLGENTTTYPCHNLFKLDDYPHCQAVGGNISLHWRLGYEKETEGEPSYITFAVETDLPLTTK